MTATTLSPSNPWLFFLFTREKCPSRYMGYCPGVRSRRLDIGQVLFCVLMDRDGVEVHKLAKQERVNIQPSWPGKSLANKGLLFELGGNSRGTRQVIPSGQDSFAGSQAQGAIWFILPAHGASHIIINIIASTSKSQDWLLRHVLDYHL